MANLQIISILKSQLSISVILGMIMFTPIKSIGNIKIQSINKNSQPSIVNLTVQETPKHLSVSNFGAADIDTIKNNLDMNAHYPGGKAAWNLFFSRNYKYSEEAMKNGINSIVIVHFIISKNGHISNAKIKSGIDKANDREVLRVVKMMPDWIPVLINDEPVDVPFVLSITLHQDSPSELVSTIYNNEEILTKTIDQQPQFPGGYNAMLKFIRDKVQYPAVAQEAGIQGTVYIRFVVRSTGKVTDVKVFKGIGIGCDEEAVRVVNEMPDWIPGRDNGKAVSVYFKIPLKFQLQMNKYNPPMPGFLK